MPIAIESYVGKKKFKDEGMPQRWVKSSYLLSTTLCTHRHDRPLKNKSHEHTVLELRWTAYLQVCCPRQEEGLLSSRNHQ